MSNTNQALTMWPRDAQGFVFLCRAAHQIGEACFPDDWAITDPTDASYSGAPVEPLPQSLETASFSQRGTAQFLLSEAGIDTNHSVVVRDPETNQKTIQLMSDTTWQLAVKLAEDHNAEIQRQYERSAPSKQRMSVVMNHMMDALLNENLRSAVRPFAGGPFTELQSAAWNFDKPLRRFASGTMNLKQPFWDENQDVYIFVDAEGVSRLLKNIQATNDTEPSNIVDHTYISPFMRLALDAVSHHQISDTNHDNKEAISEWLQKEGQRRHLDVSKRLADAAATLIRHPDAQAGRNKK